MPVCIQCGAEADRKDMFGLPPELRCGPCARGEAARLRPKVEAADIDRLPVVTLGLILAAMMITLTADRSGLAEYLVAQPSAVWEGQVWRLLTTTLPHGGFLHLLFNCIWLFRLGRAAESALGLWRYAGLLLLLACLAHSADFLLNAGAAVGLSGVVYGLFGFLFAQRRQKPYAAAAIDDVVVRSFVGWFVVCVVLTHVAQWPIANVAHGAGAAAGWLLGSAALRRPRQRLAAFAAAAMVAAGLLAATQHMPWSPRYCLHRFMAAMRDDKPDEGMQWLRRARILDERTGLPRGAALPRVDLPGQGLRIGPEAD